MRRSQLRGDNEATRIHIASGQCDDAVAGFGPRPAIDAHCRLSE